jgi:hypothetical protein
MTDLPADTEELEPAVSFDSARLIAEVRRGNEDAIAEAYRVTYGTALGRVVLLHALATIGLIGQPRAAETQDQSNHTNGRGWAVLEMARLAGFDHVAISAAGLTQTLEGAHYDRHHHGHHDDHGPATVRFGDDDGFTGGAADDGTVHDFDHGGPVG